MTSNAASPTSSTSSTINAASTGLSVSGVAALIATLVAAWTGHGAPPTDAAGVIAAVILAAAGHLGGVLHNNKALAHDAALAVAAVPDITKLRGDLDGLLPVVGDVNHILADVAPGLDRKIDSAVAKATSDISAIATQVEATTGVTAAQAKVLAHQTITEVLTALGVTLPAGLTPQTPPVTAGQAGAVDPTLPTGN